MSNFIKPAVITALVADIIFLGINVASGGRIWVYQSAIIGGIFLALVVLCLAVYLLSLWATAYVEWDCERHAYAADGDGYSFLTYCDRRRWWEERKYNPITWLYNIEFPSL